MGFDLPLIWAAIIAFVVITYVILDGFDLGIGILFPWIIDHQHKAIMINSVAPVWDGNETWMVLGAAALYGAFPLAYSLLLPTLYMPLMIMLAALIFRGVAFEFRFKAERSRTLWDFAFSLGSTLAAFCQGLILGTFVQGYEISQLFGMTAYPWFTPFSIMSGLGVVVGYALLGSTWLIIKTEGELQRVMYQAAKTLLFVMAIFLAIVSIWTPFTHPAIMERWFNTPNFYYLLPLPVATGVVLVWGLFSLIRRHERIPFIMSILLFVFAYIGLAISSWPYIVPRRLTIWEAASDEKSMEFLLVGAAILIPILIAYSIYAYYVFRGKVKATDHGYHA